MRMMRIMTMMITMRKVRTGFMLNSAGNNGDYENGEDNTTDGFFITRKHQIELYGVWLTSVASNWSCNSSYK